VSTLVFHHLPDDTKRAAFREVARLLRQGGRFLLVDFGQPQTVLSRSLQLVGSLFDGRANLRGNLAGRLPPMLRKAWS
jgi:SAM-dependent methyltransferase